MWHNGLSLEDILSAIEVHIAPKGKKGKDITVRLTVRETDPLGQTRVCIRLIPFFAEKGKGGRKVFLSMGNRGKPL